jgi:hypothetical protein
MSGSDLLRSEHSTTTTMPLTPAQEHEPPPRRTAPFDDEPGYHEPCGLWFYGNVRLLHGHLAYVEAACGPPRHSPAALDAIEAETERLVLDGKVLVCGIHSPAHQRAATVPLRWGSPRIVVFSGGFLRHLGEDLRQEPFRVARLWRYEWDAKTDLAVSRRAPEKLPTFGSHNPTVDRLIALLARNQKPGLRSAADSLMPLLTRTG